jgi:hypothetical protein
MSKLIKRTKRLFRTRYAKIAGFLALILILLAILEIADVTHFFHKSPVPPVIPVSTAQPSQQSSDQPSPSPGNDISSQPSTKGNGGSSNPSNSLPLKTPFGQFVSNHNPGSNGSPTTENSVCNTTPGASCYIKFVNGSTVTKLPSKTANSDGFASWNWDIKDAKLTKGSWIITAVAMLNGQTKTADDPLPLEIN